MYAQCPAQLAITAIITGCHQPLTSLVEDRTTLDALFARLDPALQAGLNAAAQPPTARPARAVGHLKVYPQWKPICRSEQQADLEVNSSYGGRDATLALRMQVSKQNVKVCGKRASITLVDCRVAC